MTSQLRFPEFTDEWRVKRLGDIAEFSKGSSISKNDIHENGKIEAIRYGELYTTYNEIIDEVKSKTSLSPNGLKFSKANDVIIPASGETAIDIATASCVLRDNIALSGDLNIIRTQNNGVFMTYLLNNKKKNDIARLAQGVSVIHLYSSNLKDLVLNLPSKPEQEKIADFLTAVDERIAVGEKKLELLETYKRGVMQKIFSQQVRFKDDNGNPYPDWEEKKLGEIGETYNGLTGKSGDDFGIGANFITYMQIFSDSRISQNFGKVRINPGEKQNTVEYGDIFFTTSSETPEETGYTSVLLNNPSDTYLNSFCFGYRADKNILSPEFARYLFHSSNVRSSIIRLAQGSTRYNISKVQMMKMTIAIPTKEEQQKIAGFLTALDEKITTEKSKLTATKQFKKALLQRMFV